MLNNKNSSVFFLLACEITGIRPNATFNLIGYNLFWIKASNFLFAFFLRINENFSYERGNLNNKIWSNK